MKVHQQVGDAMTQLGQAIDGERVAMLTLQEPPGLAARPMTPVEMDAQGAIWFLTSKQDLGPLVGSGPTPANLAFMNTGDSRYVSVAGHARLVDDAQRKQALWSAMARPWFSGPDDPDLTLLCVEPVQAEVWQGPEMAVTRLLAMAASAVAGKEIGLGDKKTLVR